MPDNLLTRDDVVMRKPCRFRIAFLLRVQLTTVSVAGQDYEISTVTSRLAKKTRTGVRPVPVSPLVEHDSSDTE